MAVAFTKSAEIIKNDERFKKPWEKTKFLVQGGYYFHGAVIEYLHPETNNKTGVVFVKEGEAYIVQDQSTGDFLTGKRVMTLLKKLRDDNKEEVANGEDPSESFDAYEGALQIFAGKQPTELFGNPYFDKFFTAEDRKDIQERLEELAVFDEQEFI